MTPQACLRRVDPPIEGADAPGLVLIAPGLGRADLHAARGSRESRQPDGAPGRAAPREGDRPADRRCCSRCSRVRTWSATPKSVAAVNVREIRRSYDRQTKLPRTLVEELARTTTLAQQEWVVARQKNDFPHFRPWLEKIVHLKQREAACVGERDGCLRRPARRVRARRHQRRDRAALRGAAARAGPAGRGDPGEPGPARSGAPAARDRLSDRSPADLRRDGGGDDRLRLPPRPARHHAAPVLHRDRAGRLPDHHPLRARRLQRRAVRRPPRDRARPLRPGARPRALRHADGRGRLARHPRVAVAALGKRRGPEPAVLDPCLPAGAADLPPDPGRRRPRRLPLRRQSRRAVA